MYFHHLHSESDDSTSFIIQHQGWSLLCHLLECLWGLPSVAQSSQEDFCSSHPNSAYYRPSQAQVSTSILPGAFPLSIEVTINVEHHHRKGLIQHQWGLPHRIHESRSLMRPPSDSSEISELESNYGFSCISVDKEQSRKTLNVGLSQPSFCEKGSEVHHLEEDMGKDKGNSLENGPEDHLLGDSDSPPDEDLMYGSEEELDGPGVSPSDSLTDEALLTHTEGVSRVDVGASQGLPVFVEDRGVSMEQWQEPWGPMWVFRWCRKKILLQSSKKVSPQGPTSEGLAGGDPGLRTSQTQWKKVPTQNMALEEVLGSKSSQTTSQNGQSAPERK
nr:PREDICTED: spermatogenesis-associated protein 31D1-like [Rhinolophus sinicus]